MVGTAGQPLDIELGEPYAFVGIGRVLLVEATDGHVWRDREVRVGRRAVAQYLGYRPGPASVVADPQGESISRLSIGDIGEDHAAAVVTLAIGIAYDTPLAVGIGQIVHVYHLGPGQTSVSASGGDALVERHICRSRVEVELATVCLDDLGLY